MAKNGVEQYVNSLKDTWKLHAFNAFLQTGGSKKVKTFADYLSVIGIERPKPKTDKSIEELFKWSNNVIEQQRIKDQKLLEQCDEG